MPFIDARLTVPATPEQKEQLKSAFGQAVTALHKSETYLMVQIADRQVAIDQKNKKIQTTYQDISRFLLLPDRAVKDCKRKIQKIKEVLSDDERNDNSDKSRKAYY